MHSILKHSILFFFIVNVGIIIPALFHGCVKEDKTYNTEVGPVEETSNSDIEIIVIEGHEYIIFHDTAPDRAAGGICHSESCPHLIHSSYD